MKPIPTFLIHTSINFDRIIVFFLLSFILVAPDQLNFCGIVLLWFTSISATDHQPNPPNHSNAPTIVAIECIHAYHNRDVEWTTHTAVAHVFFMSVRSLFLFRREKIALSPFQSDFRNRLGETDRCFDFNSIICIQLKRLNSCCEFELWIDRIKSSSSKAGTNNWFFHEFFVCIT